MRFTQTLFAGASLVASAFGAVQFTVGPPSTVEVGTAYTLKYTPADDTPTTILLRKGESTDLHTLSTLTESATSGTFVWTPDTSLVNGDDYALEIQQGSDNNYWGPFTVTGSSATATSSAASSSATSKASSTDSSSSTITSAPSSTLTHASASSSISLSGNGTMTSATLSRSVTGTGSAAATPTGTATDSSSSSVPTGAASMIGASPMALIFGAVAAMAYLN